MHQESRDHVYGAALGGGDNHWAPFNSKKDWEIARWAKLQGAGSTAFLELLAIDGVCFNWLSPNYAIFIHVYFTGPQSPQFVIQKLWKTQLNHQHQATRTATIHMSGGCAKWRSLRVLCMWYPWMPSCSMGRPRVWRRSHHWAWATLCRWRHDNLNLPRDEYQKVVVGYPGRDFVIISFTFSANLNILEEGPGHNSKQEHHHCTNHNFIRQNPAHAIPQQAGLPCLLHHW